MSDSTRDTRQFKNFVPALREPSPQIIEIEVPKELPASPQTVLLPKASYTDRAKGFSIAAAPLAMATGFVALLIGVSAFGVPLLSVGALLLALGGFAFVWLVAYIAHTLISPDGAAFFHVVLMWGYLRREQTNRFKRYGMKGHSNDRQ